VPRTFPLGCGLTSAFRTAAVALVCAVSAVGCHEEGTVEVKDLSFSGLHAFTSSQIQSVLATRESGWLPWSRRHYFDRKEFDADLARIHAFYVDHGYPAQRIAGVDVAVSSDKKSVRVTIAVDEGQPVVVQQVRFEGFEKLDESVRSRLDDAPLVAGEPRDRDRVRASRDLAVRLLKDNGYPFGYVDAGERPGDTPGQLIVTFRADPGPVMRFGEVSIEGLERVNATLVRRYLAFASGDVYRESQVLRTQRRLTAVQAFELASVTSRLEEAAGDRVPMRITVAEGRPRRLKFGFGYGTEERGRGAFQWQHVNFFGGGRIAQVAANASFLDQGLELSLVEPRLGRPGVTTEFSGLAHRTRQLTYDWESYGVRAGVVYRTEGGTDGTREPVRYEFRTSYGYEFLKYGIHADSIGDLTHREERIALGFDPDTGRSAGTLASVNFDVRRAAVDDAIEPRRGTIATLHLTHAAPWLLGSYRFDEVMFDGRAYTPLGSTILASHVQLGSIGASDPAKVPFARRYFLGGATTLRGWGRYQVGPLDEHGLQIGGRTLVLLSAEARIPLRGKLSGVAFVDAGNVGSSDWSVGRMHLRMDVGPGLRYLTPIGALRADLGYQVNRVPGLVINGQPEVRHWRLHLSIGQAF